MVNVIHARHVKVINNVAERWNVSVLQQGYIDDYSVTVVFRNKAQYAGNGLSPCQVL